MGFTPDAPLRFLRSLFPLTFRGLSFLLLSAALLTEGIFRADLAALFWGSSFFLVTAYALLAGHLFRMAAGRGSRIAIQLPQGGHHPGEEAEALFVARLPRGVPPGFSVHLLLPLAWHDRRVDGIRQRLGPGSHQGRVTFRAEHRGVYVGKAAVLEAADALGLAAHRLSVPCAERLVIYPHVVPARELPGRVEQTDQAAVDSFRRRRSEELLEARKYYPGDDPRRLNWKVFAHTGEMFLRIGEEVPPPESRLLFVLDTAANPLVPRALAPDYLDRLVQSCASFMVRLVRRGMEVTLSLPGQRECRTFGSGGEMALLAVLAEAWWSTVPWEPELPAGLRQAAVFSSPGSSGLPLIMARLGAGRWAASVYLQDLDPIPARAALRLRDLLFAPRQVRTRPAAAFAGERAGFGRALERDLRLYQGTAMG